MSQDICANCGKKFEEPYEDFDDFLRDRNANHFCNNGKCAEEFEAKNKSKKEDIYCGDELQVCGNKDGLIIDVGNSWGYINIDIKTAVELTKKLNEFLAKENNNG